MFTGERLKRPGKADRDPMNLLVVTNMYPTEEQPAFGIFVQEQVEALRSAGIQVTVLFINGRASRLNYFWGVLRYWWKLLSADYDLVHAHHALTGLLARLQWYHPLVVTYHGTEVSSIVPRWLSFLARDGGRFFDRIIVVNETEKELVKDRAKVRLIPCGVDLDKFRPMPLVEARRALDLPLDKPLILWVGQRRQWVKRLELAEQAISLVKEKLPDAELVVVSGQPHSLIPTFMSACDVFLHTSRYEGSPMVIKEAMACNLPIVSTPVGDVAQVIESVEGCYLVEPEPRDIAQQLLRVLGWGQRTNGRIKIGGLSSETAAQRVSAVYRELYSNG